MINPEVHQQPIKQLHHLAFSRMNYVLMTRPWMIISTTIFSISIQFSGSYRWSLLLLTILLCTEDQRWLEELDLLLAFLRRLRTFSLLWQVIPFSFSEHFSFVVQQICTGFLVIKMTLQRVLTFIPLLHVALHLQPSFFSSLMLEASLCVYR